MVQKKMKNWPVAPMGQPQPLNQTWSRSAVDTKKHVGSQVEQRCMFTANDVWLDPPPHSHWSRVPYICKQSMLPEQSSGSA